MPTTVAALNLLLFLLPGLLTLKVREALAVVAKVSDFSRAVDTLFFSLVNYLIYVGVAKVLKFPVFTILRVEAKEVASDIRLIVPEFLPLLVLLAIAFGMGILTGVGNDRDWFHNMWRGVGLTRRTAKLDVWSDVLNEIRGQYLLVYLDSGVKVFGWPYRYSDDPERRGMFLKEATIYDKDWDERQVAGEGVMLTEASKIVAIEFLSPQLGA